MYILTLSKRLEATSQTQKPPHMQNKEIPIAEMRLGSSPTASSSQRVIK